MKQQSYVMIKPSFANNKFIINEIKRRLTEKGILILEESYIQYDEKRAKMHYHEHVGKGFYPELEKYITSDVAYGMKVEGENAISIIRELAGSTKNPAPGTIRYDIPYALHLPIRVTENVVHSSDSENAAKLELGIFESLKKEYEKNNDLSK